MRTVLLIVAVLSSSALAGPLTPPAGIVASTYKTLTEVEPRTAINAASTPGDTNSLFKITQPGSYYLTGNITGVSAKHGIEIDASGVTLDLGGFRLLGVSGSLSGIATEGTRNNLIIRNGTISSWGQSGIHLFALALGTGSVIESVVASSNGGGGILGNDCAVIRDCAAHANGTIGIYCANNGSITNCHTEENGSYGIEAIGGSVIANCTASKNRKGIVADYGSTITACSARENTEEGIVGFWGCIVSNCTAYENAEAGIRVTINNTVVGNVCSDNGPDDSIGAGILVENGDNRIEGNNCADNDFGIKVDSPGNMIVRNSCTGNTQNWVIVSNNIHGPIIDRTAPGSPAVLGNAAAGTMGSSDPNANFSY